MVLKKGAISRPGMPRPRPDWDGETLRFEGKLCRIFKKAESKQVKLLDALKRNAWRPLEGIALEKHNSREELSNTIKKIENIVILYSASTKSVSWKTKEFKGKYPENPKNPECTD